MRQFSQPARISLITASTSEVWLSLLTIDIDGQVYRVVANSKDAVTSNGEVYTPYPFDVTLPAELGASGGIEQVQVTIDNVDLMLVDALRAAVSPLKFTLQFVLVSQPDTVELELTDLEGHQVQFNSRVITATLSLVDTWNAKFPSVGNIYDPIQCPGLF